jgi:amidase
MPIELSRRQLLWAGAAGAAGTWIAGCATRSQSTGATAALPEPVWRADAVALAGAIAARQVSSREVVEAHLERIEAVNGSVNAVTRVLSESALEAANRADAAVARGDALGPFHGVPLSIKENIDLVGVPTTHGVRAFERAFPQADSPTVERMKAAGAIPIARTNMPDLGLRVHTESELFGTTRNPWSPGLTAGGSSGGEGAALATGMSAIGLGNDIGGSLRNPAFCCGIASLKPSTGRIPRYTMTRPRPNLAQQWLAVEGPMARSVADLVVALAVLGGPDPRDPRAVPVALDAPRPPEPRRVALVPKPSGGDTHPAIAEGVRAAGRALAAAGLDVEEREPPQLAAVGRLWGDLIATGIAVDRKALDGALGAHARHFLSYALEILPPQDLAGFDRAIRERHELARAWAGFFADRPIAIGPVFTRPPFPAGYDLRGRSEAEEVLGMIRLTVAANALGLPSVCVPVGSADGLPLGVQVMGAPFREPECLWVAQRIEAAFGALTPIDPRGA